MRVVILYWCLVHTCSTHSNTVGRCAVFCALLNCIDSCKCESVVDVFQTVKALRLQKPGAIQTVVRDNQLMYAIIIMVQLKSHSISIIITPIIVIIELVISDLIVISVVIMTLSLEL